MSRTRYALWLYYLAVGFLTICAGVIVVKLIVFPPCAPRGNTCVVDPWSAAGLESAVLGVSATVLAILGAVAVAGWWTSLNERVKDQVGVLYESQKAEVRHQLDDYVTMQKQEVGDRLGAVQTSIQSVESHINEAATDIDRLETLTNDFEEILIDGMMVWGAVLLENWAKKAMATQRFRKVPAKMTESYLNYISSDIEATETEVAGSLDFLHTAEQKFKELSSTVHTAADFNWVVSSEVFQIQNILNAWLSQNASDYQRTNRMLTNWEGALRWVTITKDNNTDAATLQRLEEQIEKYRSRLEHLKQDHEQLREKTPTLLQQISSLMKEKGIFIMPTILPSPHFT